MPQTVREHAADPKTVVRSRREPPLKSPTVARGQAGSYAPVLFRHVLAVGRVVSFTRHEKRATCFPFVNS